MSRHASSSACAASTNNSSIVFFVSVWCATAFYASRSLAAPTSFSAAHIVLISSFSAAVRSRTLRAGMPLHSSPAPTVLRGVTTEPGAMAAPSQMCDLSRTVTPSPIKQLSSIVHA